MTLSEYFKANKVERIDIGRFDYEYKKLENVLGKRVWICDYRISSKGVLVKPIRCIKPTLAEITMNDDKHQVYYSPIHFREIKRNGNIGSKVIPPFDNTGYRYYSGVSLNIFETEEECLKFFRSQVESAIKEIESEMESINKELNNKKDDLLKMLL